MITIHTQTRLVVFPDREYRTTFKPDQDGGYFVCWARTAPTFGNAEFHFQGFWSPRGMNEFKKQRIYRKYIQRDGVDL